MAMSLKAAYYGAVEGGVCATIHLLVLCGSKGLVEREMTRVCRVGGRTYSRPAHFLGAYA